MKTDHVKFRRAPETKFLSVDEEVFDKLSPYALKVYGQLRKLTSYTKENDETEITVKNLANASGISERKTYDCLNELEHDHFIIQRHNIYHIRYGQINTFDVSQTYGFFRPAQSQTTTAPQAAPVDNSGQNLSPTAPRAVPPAQYAEPTAPRADLYKEQDLSQEVSKKKHNKAPVKPSVFSDKQTVKTHIEMVVANRANQEPLDDDILDQGTFYAYETNKDKSFDSINKRINIFLKKVREGKWLIPQGWKGITSQSIRETEEQQQAEKREQYKQEAVAMQAVFGTVNNSQGFKDFGALFKKLKDEVNGQTTNDTGMQKQAV